MKNHFLSIISILILLNACKTADKDVEQLVHKRQTPAPEVQEARTYKNQYINKIRGAYTMLDGTPLTVDGSGSFKLGEIEYFLHEALNDYQAIYVAVTPDPHSTKKIYTYHGIITTGKNLLSAPYKAPNFQNKRRLTEKDTDFAWQVNTFQAENINWTSGFSTVFASREDANL
ncbi:MAG: hypothetical protein ACRCWI_06660 [Brevinema sp.]